ISMRRIVLQSALGGMALSLVAMGFAAGGFITPVAGALLQEVIDVLAIVNALRMTWQKRIEADIGG
ncbi:MAG TPA: heavy metal translocating P-type ATPase, partial [Alphaproteobacteria bacterium]|nr:heavy metal translocating P-type ATPase [Alphaproteobacteria bacterium]